MLATQDSTNRLAIPKLKTQNAASESQPAFRAEARSQSGIILRIIISTSFPSLLCGHVLDSQSLVEAMKCSAQCFKRTRGVPCLQSAESAKLHSTRRFRDTDGLVSTINTNSRMGLVVVLSWLSSTAPVSIFSRFTSATSGLMFITSCIMHGCCPGGGCWKEAEHQGTLARRGEPGSLPIYGQALLGPPPFGGMWGPLSPVVWLWVFGV